MSENYLKLQYVDLSVESGWLDLLSEISICVGTQLPNIKNKAWDQIKKILMRNAVFAIVDYPYRDEDAFHDYARDYVKAFKDYSRGCARVLFFGGEPGEVVESNWLEKIANEKTRPAYLGSVVFRPTGSEYIGKTLIAPSSSANQFIHVKQKFSTYLTGIRLDVDGSPFMQQDLSSHACAGAAIWATAFYLHRHYGTPRYFPKQITEIASNNFELGTAAVGLTTQQMARMLRHMGCDLHLQHVHRLEHQHRPDREAIHYSLLAEIYGYVQSNIPVLLGYWFKDKNIGHVVMVVGHDLGKKIRPAWREGQKDTFLLNSDFVSKLYVQDDQRGPYFPLEVWDDDPEFRKANHIPHADIAEARSVHCLEHADSIMVLPAIAEGIHVKYAKAVEMFKQILLKYQPEIDECMQGMKIKEDDGVLRHRIYLQQRRRFRALIHEAKIGRRGLDPEHIKAYRTMRLPRYIYVCDICVPCDGLKGEFDLLGEILIDATSPLFEHTREHIDGKRTEPVLSIRISNALYLTATKPNDVILGKYEQLVRSPKNPTSIL